MANDLKSQLSLLRSLQDVYVSLHRIDTELSEIPQKIEDAKAGYNSANELISAKIAEKAALEKKHRDESGELDANVAHIKDRETKLYAIKTNKEYQAAIKEIADAKQANKEREDQIIGIMEKMDVLSAEITQLSASLADKEKEFRAKEAELKDTAKLLEMEKSEEQAKVADSEKTLDQNILKQYRFIQKRYSDAMAVAAKGICQGCYKRIPPQVYIELQKWKELITCPNCHRILFFEEPVTEDKENV